VLRPERAYGDLGFILGLAGTLGIKGFEDEAVFVQDLSRILLNSRVRRLIYTTAPIATINGNVDTQLQYNDASDWAEIQENGIIIASDAALPRDTDERIIIGASITVGGVDPTELSSAELTRQAPVTATVRQSLVEWTQATTSHLTMSVVAPNLLPQTLSINEATLFLRIVGVDTNGLGTLSVQMLAAERGVMNLYPGV